MSVTYQPKNPGVNENVILSASLKYSPVSKTRDCDFYLQSHTSTQKLVKQVQCSRNQSSEYVVK